MLHMEIRACLPDEIAVRAKSGEVKRIEPATKEAKRKRRRGERSEIKATEPAAASIGSVK